MIQFKYALQKGGANSAADSVRANSAAAALKAGVRGVLIGTIFESVDELPHRFRPTVPSEAEMETILMGGATPYVPKHLLKKK